MNFGNRPEWRKDNEGQKLSKKASFPDYWTLDTYATETTIYPDGISDHVVHVDRRGVRMVTTHRPFGDREESVTLTFSPTSPDALYENVHEYGFSLTFTRTLTPGSLACRFFHSF